MRSRALLPLLVAIAAALGGCKLDPGGRCASREECPAGLDCLQGVCASCRDDRDCADWAACAATGLCEPRAGRCRIPADCAAWEGCDAGHACVLLPDRCPNVACGDIEACDPAHACSLQPGRCNVDADCAAWMAGCDEPSRTCTFGAAPGDDVVAWGTLVEGRDDRAAAARVTAPAKVEVGFDAGAGGDEAGLRATGDVAYRAFLDPTTGALVYRHVGDPGGDTLRRFHRDEDWTAPASPWTYPLAPSADDVIAIDAAKCPKTWDRWVMQAGTGAVLYGCPAGFGTWDFYDAAGAARAKGVLAIYAWSASDRLLARSGAGVLRILDASGTATVVSGLPAGTHLAYRTVALPAETGFRVALHDDGASADELWTIDEATGAATILGTYAAVTGGYLGLSWEVLDTDGALYGRAWVSAPEVVLKRPLAPASLGAPVYDEGKMPAGSDDFSAATFKPWLRLDRSFLFSRP